MEREKILEGLNNVRGSIVRLALSFVALTAASYFFWKEILRFIQRPLGISLVYYSMPEAFLATVKISLFAGIFLSVPFIFKELWDSIAPFFTPLSRRYSAPVVISASFLFYAGAGICYYLLLPAGIKFLVSYETGHIKPATSLDSYISFFASFTFGLGFAFEMPLVMLLLAVNPAINLVSVISITATSKLLLKRKVWRAFWRNPGGRPGSATELLPRLNREVDPIVWTVLGLK